jgi:integrase
MAIRDKKTVLKKIRQCERIVGGKPYQTFEIYFGTDGHGKKLRENKSTLQEAKARVDEFFAEHARLGDAARVLGPTEIYDAKAALNLLASAGLAVCLTEAARSYVEGWQAKTVCREKKIGEAFTEYVNGISESQHLHRTAVGARVGKWVMSFGPDRLASEVTAVDVAEYLAPMKLKSMKTYNNALSYIKTFMAWCSKSQRMYSKGNPLDDMKPVKLAYKEPEFMPVDDFEKFIRACESHEDAPRLMPFIALSFFCGIRQEEIKRLIESRKDIDLDAETIRISMPKGWTQGITPRIFQLEPCALEWLMKYSGEPILCKSTRACLESMAVVAKKLGIKLVKNGGRHSFITYHAAAYGDPSRTDTITGTSKKMRSAHYQGLVSKADAVRYFSITPTEKKASA